MSVKATVLVDNYAFGINGTSQPEGKERPLSCKIILISLDKEAGVR
jgi:hypothetical protein